MLLNCLESLHKNMVDLEETLIGGPNPVFRRHVMFQSRKIPFTTCTLVVILRLFLHCNVGQMRLRVCQVVRIVSGMSEPGKPVTVGIDSQRRERSD